MTQEYSRDSGTYESGTDDSSDGDYTPDPPPSGTWIDPKKEQTCSEGCCEQPDDLTSSTAGFKLSTDLMEYWHCTAGCCKFYISNKNKRELTHCETVRPPQIKRQQPLILNKQKPT